SARALHADHRYEHRTAALADHVLTRLNPAGSGTAPSRMLLYRGRKPMFRLIAQRSVQTVVALFALLVLVFLLSRLTGDPTVFYLPLDAPLEARRAFSELH